MNAATGYGPLRAIQPGERPNPRDIVICRTLPNELSRVAGIISTVPQTPLSHVNLRAVQDGIHARFADLYGVRDGERFAVEIEFKITRDNVLAIKQASLWVFRWRAIRNLCAGHRSAGGA